MRIAIMVIILIAGFLVLLGTACDSATQEEVISPTQTQNSTPLSTVDEPVASSTPVATDTHGSPTASPVPSVNGNGIDCFSDLLLIQPALTEYFQETWKWPTDSGGFGDIEWDKLIPDYLVAIPLSDVLCDWQVNKAPEGTVCLINKSEKAQYCACGSACVQSSSEISDSPISEEEPAECKIDRADIQAALDAYHLANGEWPTEDGQPGRIVWDNIVPDLLEEIPLTFKCKWQVNSDPLGEVCRSVHC